MAKAKPGVKAITPEVLPPEQAQEIAVIQTDGSALVSFLNGLVPFFTRARELEVKATDYLAEAKRLIPPDTADDDAKIQTFIRTGTAAKKTVEEHWTITAIMSGVHRKLTARRAVATGALESANTIAQKLHNDYADRKRREAAAEQERVRLVAEANARKDREAELARLDAEALAAEESSAGLSEREQAFVANVLIGKQPENAARDAGFKEAFKSAARLMSQPKIMAALEAGRAAEVSRQQAAALREQPLDVQVEEVKPDLVKAGGFDRTTHSAEVVDVLALVMAFKDGKHGIPPDVFEVNQAKLNEYARSLQERINLWPGVRHKKTTKTV